MKIFAIKHDFRGRAQIFLPDRANGAVWCRAPPGGMQPPTAIFHPGTARSFRCPGLKIGGHSSMTGANAKLLAFVNVEIGTISCWNLWCPGADLNHRHGDFQSPALPLSYPGAHRRGADLVAAAAVVQRVIGWLSRHGIAFAQPVEQIAILAAGRTERRVRGDLWLAAQRAAWRAGSAGNGSRGGRQHVRPIWRDLAPPARRSTRPAGVRVRPSGPGWR